ncbi:alanyl-tRNA ligase [Candidatus Mycoplasma haematolamae str. Purdue]|uniref:alanine--tRNA ligase n=1 Tax=Mycoplasma haematolamae (strain Purdue) TaxID=1212765 RepID=I7B925_MYCHA|nr:alanine--tRNA ligase-related protein [Candidatus Mycoplasma haematolamae]AFO51765.1 alanyl-tRNA ligase [Candidatus Mycoplasma haematolamae str. Purdue]
MGRSITPAELKTIWLDYFKSKGHTVIDSHSLIPPENDKSTLFINSGMCAIKQYFISGAKNQMFTSVQKVVRTVDITSIEEDAWHSTYFEMMGNFSIGGYFKREAVEYAVEFLLKHLKLDPKNFVITVHEEDSETEDIWRSLLGSDISILRLGSSNFWEIGEGPCGPCTEIYYDRGEKYDPKGLSTKLISENIPNDRYIEIWNIVFSQYWAKEGKYEELETKNIDTGAGLERLITILEEAEDVFHSSQFSPLIKEIEANSRFTYYGVNPEGGYRVKAQFQVIADHLRTLTLLLGEGLTPSNKGRGYVLRKLLRRSIVGLYILEVSDISSSLRSLSEKIFDILVGLHPFLEGKLPEIQEKILSEYEGFKKILESFDSKIQREISNREGGLEQRLFTLVEREGVPYALIEKMVTESNTPFSREAYEECSLKHQSKSKNEKFLGGFDLSS